MNIVDILRSIPASVWFALIGYGAMVTLLVMLKRSAGDNLLSFLSGCRSLLTDKRRSPRPVKLDEKSNNAIDEDN